MDTYAVKFQSLQHYVPFLNKMILKLEKAGDREKEPQLNKMKSLHGILTEPGKKVRFETLLKCEEVLQKLYEKVEGTSADRGGGWPRHQDQSAAARAASAAARDSEPGATRSGAAAGAGGFTLSSSLRYRYIAAFHF